MSRDSIAAVSLTASRVGPGPVYYSDIVRHILLLVDFLCLAAGLACLARIVASCRAERSERSRALLAFFCAYSFVMIASTLFAYAAVNIGVDSSGQLALTSLIFAGMAALELTLPRLIYAEKGTAVPSVARKLLLAGAALTAAQAGLIWLPPQARPASFICAFGSFGAAVAFAALAGVRRAPAADSEGGRDGARGGGSGRRGLPPGWPFGVAYGLIMIGAVFEVRSMFSASASQDYLPISLPLAYLTSSLQFYLASSRRQSIAAPALGLSLPADLVEERRLSPREVEVAGCILEGLGNKEIAARLGISENTARNHIYSLYQKLGIQKRMDLLGLMRSRADGRKVPPSPGASR